MENFLRTLLALSAGGGLMALLLMGLRYILVRNMPSTIYYYLWIPVLLRLVLPIPALSILHTELTPAMENRPAVVEREDTAKQSRAYIQPGIFSFTDHGELPEKDTQPMPVPHPEKTMAGIDLPNLPWAKIGFAVWLSGAVISLGLGLYSYLRFYALIRRYAITPERDDVLCYTRINKRSKPELIRSDYVRTPMLMGVFRTLMVLPDTDYTKTQLNNIFLHELMHYRRRDICYKWLCVPVFAAHWFNPLVYLMRREIGRACELSCDEMLIKRMDRQEKQSYGDTLISLASAGKLPAGIVATTFNMEKQALKERLVRIMKFKERKIGSVIALVLSLLLLAGCGAVAGPAPAEKSDPVPAAKPMTLSTTVSTADIDAEDGAVVVSTVDEFLAAIAPNTTIRLKPGEYDLSLASDYGDIQEGKYYSWSEVYEGYELVIPGVEGLRIIGSYEETTISTQPRYANVLKFVGCDNISLESVVVGHTEGQGYCSGGVVYLQDCSDMNFGSCHLFGCGTIGIYAQNCRRIYAEKCAIYDCSYNAVYSVASSDIRLSNCDIYDCGENTYGGQSIFSVDTTMGFAAVNCKIYNNTAATLVESNYSKELSLLGCEIRNNIFTDSIFCCGVYAATVEACSFEKNHYTYFNTLREWVEAVAPVNAEGETLTEDTLLAMERSEASYDGPPKAASVELEETVGEDGLRHITVSTVDEFLAAIGNDTVITLGAELFDLSTASDYGAYGNDYYYWIDIYDGPGLVISGVKNLSIVGEGATIAAIPRYANVLGFVNCENIRLEGFTAGHTQEPGSCAGGVLDFQNCDSVDIADCHLYGCGILGISASGCTKLYVENTEIYDCSQGAIALYVVDGAEFVNCDIHDCYSPEIGIHDGRKIIFDGESLKGGMYRMENGKPVEFRYQ